jgi:hypothetical protein
MDSQSRSDITKYDIEAVVIAILCDEESRYLYPVTDLLVDRTTAISALTNGVALIYNLCDMANGLASGVVNAYIMLTYAVSTVFTSKCPVEAYGGPDTGVYARLYDICNTISPQGVDGAAGYQFSINASSAEHHRTDGPHLLGIRIVGIHGCSLREAKSSS